MDPPGQSIYSSIFLWRLTAYLPKEFWTLSFQESRILAPPTSDSYSHLSRGPYQWETLSLPIAYRTQSSHFVLLAGNPPVAQVTRRR